eukprot:3835702-Amphidinium_carterae.2
MVVHKLFTQPMPVGATCIRLPSPIPVMSSHRHLAAALHQGTPTMPLKSNPRAMHMQGTETGIICNTTLLPK